MSREYNLAVFIGRFQPAHNAHVEIIKQSLELADNVLVIIGSSFQPRTYKNPFTQYERTTMLQRGCAEAGVDLARVFFDYNTDTRYDDGAWLVRTQKIVNTYAKIYDDPKVVVVGHKKEDDPSTYYLDMFPQWGRVDHQLIEPLDATHIRDFYFKDIPNLNYLNGVVPLSVREYLDEWRQTQYFKDVVQERKFAEMYKEQFSHLRYAPIFVTTDAVVVQNAHVLLVKRGAYPGKGLWAFPGGFVDAEGDKSVQDAMVRELREETKIDLPEKVIVGNIEKTRVFDAPGRSSRGRTITHAFYVTLPDGNKLPKVKGSDDAVKAQWVPIADVKSEDCFEDHYEILQCLTGGK